ncbi:MAG: hypothetical protein K2X27_00825, partial [Candidatus Obscuribacterales bacterium]|nr:hypothetical protein [Candidatus Obscuribacterales bacterium]
MFSGQKRFVSHRFFVAAAITALSACSAAAEKDTNDIAQAGSMPNQQAQSSSNSGGNNPAEKKTGDKNLKQAIDLYRLKQIKEAIPLFELAIKEYEQEKRNIEVQHKLALANHALGHCRDYLWTGDHGEDCFRSAMQLYEGKGLNPQPGEGQKSINWAMMMCTNNDWAEALFRNKKYKEAADAYNIFLGKQSDENSMVAMCPMYNDLNGTYLGQPTNQHLIESSLNVFNSTSDKTLLKTALSTIGNAALFSSHGFFESIDMVRREAEHCVQSGKMEEAKTLLQIDEDAIFAYLTKPRHNLDSEYQKAYPALLKHMKAASGTSNLFSTIESPLSKEADKAESAYWKGEYE